MASVPNIIEGQFDQSDLGRRSGAITGVAYLPPTPFVLFTKVGSQPREILNYSARVLEDIMYELNQELNNRKQLTLQWRRYKRAAGDTIEFDLFTPKKNGNQISGYPLKFFPEYVTDIQNVIDALIDDTRVPDTFQSYFARIFTNNSTHGINFYNEFNKLKNNVPIIDFTQLHGSDNFRNRTTLIDPLDDATDGDWPFDDTYIKNAVPLLGINPRGEIQAKDRPTGLESQDPNWPQSVLGTTTPSGIPGLDTSMLANNRPFKINSGTDDQSAMQRIHSIDTSLGVGAGQVDKDQGYGYLTHFAHTVQMLRYQPPIVEWFPDNAPFRDYVSPVTSNTTPNLDWVLAQPVIRGINQNWADWLVHGRVGFSNGVAVIQAYQNERADVGRLGSCPENVFFPDPFETCSCQWIESAYILWFAEGQGFIWEQTSYPQFGRAQPIPFGPHTKMRVNFTYTGIANVGFESLPFDPTGDNTQATLFQVGIRTERLGLINSQPFFPIINVDSSDVAINIQERLSNIENAIVPETGQRYTVGGLDRITAIIILVQSADSRQVTVALEDGPGGSFIPEGSEPDCELSTATVRVNSVEIFEEKIEGDPVNDYL
jgi:hypothetical protein